MVNQSYASELLANRILVEAMSDLIDDDLSPEAVNEGYNLDLRSIMKECKKQFKQAANECKKAIKAGDKAEAKKKAEELNSIIDVAIKNIKKLEADTDLTGTTVSAVIGYFTSIFGDIEYFIKGTLICFIPIAGPIAGIVIAIKKLIEEVTTIINDIKNYDGDAKDIVKIFNAYRLTSISILEKLKGKIKNLEKQIDKMN